MAESRRPYAVVTGASTGIGYELAKCCARNGYDLLIAANEPEIHTAANDMREFGATVETLEVDLATFDGVDKLYDKIAHRRVDALLANAGRGLGKSFLDQDPQAWRYVIDTNIVGTLYLISKVGNDMRDLGAGRILITGSIAGFVPGTFHAVYNATKAFLDSFSFALRHEMKDSGVTVTCLMPGATETEFFKRADLMDTKLGVSEKAEAADVAKLGFDAMMNGEGEVIAGWMNKMRAAMGSIMPADASAEMHARQAMPGSAAKS